MSVSEILGGDGGTYVEENDGTRLLGDGFNDLDGLHRCRIWYNGGIR
jgi:hypothetical protein